VLFYHRNGRNVFFFVYIVVGMAKINICTLLIKFVGGCAFFTE